MDLILVTGDAGTARWAEHSGIDRVMVDLERLGKKNRQRGHDLFLSSHTNDDVAAVRAVLQSTRLEVRIDRWNEASRRQIDEVIEAGADVIMLAMVETVESVCELTNAVSGRAKICLLVESVAGLVVIEDLCTAQGVDEIHFGLNDLMISRRGRHIFEPLIDGTLAGPSRLVRAHGLGLGIGGIAPPDTPDLPVDPNVVTGQLISMNVTMGWLGRSFLSVACHSLEAMERAVTSVRQAVVSWERATPEAFIENERRFRNQLSVAYGKEASEL